MCNRRIFSGEELSIVKDPHHQGFWSWGWDGINLWIKAKSTKRWTKVNSIKFTPSRFSILFKLTNGAIMNTIKMKKNSQIF